MGFNKPFRAIPVVLGPYYKARQRRKQGILVAKVLGVAVAGGLTVGVLGAMSADDKLRMSDLNARDAASSFGQQLWRTTEEDAYYAGCDDARAAGVAPLHVGEPGYRVAMDGDGDGIACEPYRS